MKRATEREKGGNYTQSRKGFCRDKSGIKLRAMGKPQKKKQDDNGQVFQVGGEPIQEFIRKKHENCRGGSEIVEAGGRALFLKRTSAEGR